MAAGGTLDILAQIEALVSDKLQVVSYKWLSRNFSVSSNYAKRLLQEFVEKHGNEFEVLYSLSGWLKNNPQTYGIRLASGLNLAEAKQEFKDNCSVQVYSVQASIPKDLAVLWSTEFVQSEELFNQPLTAENCFWDNRFSGVSNSFVKCIVDGKPLSAAPLQSKSAAPQQSKISLEVDIQPKPKSTIKEQPVQPPPEHIPLGEKSDSVAPKVTEQTSKPHVTNESAPAVQTNKRKVQNEKPSSGNGGSLASLWGRASSKPKPLSSAKQSNDSPNAAHTAEAQIARHESVDADISDDDALDVSFKREPNGASGRKRRVVMDFSDDDSEEENAVSLASPDPPKGKPVPDSLCKTEKSIPEKKNLAFEDQKTEVLDVRKASTKEKTSGSLPEGAKWTESMNTNAGITLQKKTQCCIPEGVADQSKKDKAADSSSTSPKRRKVLKTRIDERGREVTEVVWEGEAAASLNTDNNTTTNGDGNRAPATNKAPEAAAGSNAPTNPASKAVSNKPTKDNKPAKGGGGKDRKQGNILSFFKKV